MKKLGIFLAIFILLVGGGYVFGRNLKSGGSNPLSQLLSSKKSLTDTAEEGIVRSSIKNLLTQNKAMKCTIEMTGDADNGQGEITGITYVANNKMRSDMEIKIEAEDGSEIIQAHTISDGDWIYTWASDTKMPATKMKISELGDLSANQANLAEGLKNLEEEHDYHCSRWFPVDKSKFVPPSDIKFEDMTEMMKGFGDVMKNMDTGEMEKEVEDAKQQLCQMCQMAPDEETKAECLKSAGCDE